MAVTFEVHDGEAIWAGDISIGKAQDIPATRDALLRAPSTARFSMFTDDGDRRWPNGRIPYVIDSSVNIPLVQMAIDSLMKMTNGIHMVKRTNEEDFIRYRSSSSICWSAIGRDGGLQDIKLSSNCNVGTVMHETMHAIGFLHEQQRCDRSQYVDILYENIIESKKSNFDSGCDVWFDGGFDVGAYDEASIMHYHPLSFSKNGLPTIRSLRNRDALMGRREFSAGDLAAVDRFYGAFNDAPVVVLQPLAASYYDYTPITFDASQSYDVDDPSLTYQWDFGDGYCDAPPHPPACTAMAPTHRYVTTGKMQGWVAVRDAGSVTRQAFTIVIENTPPKVVLMQPVPSKVFEGASFALALELSDNRQDSITVTINRGDGSPPTVEQYDGANDVYIGIRVQKTWQVTYPRDGQYTLSVTATDSKGASTTFTQHVGVFNAPPRLLFAMTSTPVTSGQSVPYAVQLEDPADNGGPWTYHWTLGFRPALTGSFALPKGMSGLMPLCTPGTFATALRVTTWDGSSSIINHTLTVLPVPASLDVLPSAARNTVSLSSTGQLSVALRGSARFDVTRVDPASVLIGNTLGIDTPIVRLKSGAYSTQISDIDRDGYPDMLMMVSIPSLVANGDLTASTTSLTLRAVLKDGCSNLRAQDAVVMTR